MKLINAEDFSRVIKEYCKDCIDHNKHKMDVVDVNADIQDFINNQPTAFDVDKVVEKLEETREKDIPRINNTTTTRDEKVYKLAMSYAIKIVKAGGIDEKSL